jgi:hypothetical protein
LHLLINEQTYGFARFTASQSVVVVVNNSGQPEPVEINVPAALQLAEGRVLRNLLGAGAEVRVEGGKLKFTIDRKAAVILS